MNAISKFRQNHVSGPFPLKLQTIIKILDEEDESNDLIRWQPHGRAFTINATTNPEEFQEKVMKRFFHNSKVASFFRQINIYDFKRMKKGPDAGCYYHEMFVRGRPDLANAIARNCVKGDTSDRRRSSNDDSEPNFYAMDSVLLQERCGGIVMDQQGHGSTATIESDISRMMVLSSVFKEMQKAEKKPVPSAFSLGGANAMNASPMSAFLLNRCTSPTSIISDYAGIFQNINENEASMGLSSFHKGLAATNNSSSLTLVLLRLLAAQQQQRQQETRMQMTSINDQLTTALLNDLVLSSSNIPSMPSSTTWL